MNSRHLSLYITAEHECGYYDDRLTANLIPDPQIEMSSALYNLLVGRGFRRSGGFVYRPHCKQCDACIPCRIDVESFRPQRSLRRCLKRNAEVTTRVVEARFKEEYFTLYQRYINSRHLDGTMVNPTREDFTSFLLNDWGSSIFIESRLDQQLISIAVVDFLSSGLSAVYTFFDPDFSRYSPGSFAILQQIWLARLYQLPHVYLGYWIDGHPKMDYKRNFIGLEIFDQDQWNAFERK